MERGLRKAETAHTVHIDRAAQIESLDGFSSDCSVGTAIVREAWVAEAWGASSSDSRARRGSETSEEEEELYEESDEAVSELTAAEEIFTRVVD